jgi:hypothetical protein
MKDPGAPKQGELVHRVVLCRQDDIVDKDGAMELRRTGVVRAWARIKSYYGLPAFVGQHGFTVVDPITRATHNITVRAGLAVDVTYTAWIYEERRKGMPRWYKVLGFSESSSWLNMPCRLVEKSDTAQVPREALAPQPQRVEL